MKGQLWQPCEICGTEPVCINCLKCEKHCRCVKAVPVKPAKPTTKANCGFCSKAHYTMMGFDCLSKNGEPSNPNCPAFDYQSS